MGVWGRRPFLQKTENRPTLRRTVLKVSMLNFQLLPGPGQPFQRTALRRL